MYSIQKGLYAHRSTMDHFAKPGYPFMNLDTFPFTNANLADLPDEKTHPIRYPKGDTFEQDVYKEDSMMNNNPPAKKPLTKAERRAEHNAIERARRESLNTKFQCLAQALPNLMNYRRPSKSQIVEKALDWVKQSIIREERYRYQILQLQRENKRLLAQFMSSQQQQPSPNTMPLNASPIPMAYGDFEPNNGWSNPTLLPQMPSFNEDMARHEFGSKTDDEDSSNEDDIDYHQPSPIRRASLFEGSHGKHQLQPTFMDNELYSVINTNSFNPAYLPEWQQKYSSMDSTNQPSFTQMLA
ncbi:hypothetical protein RMCBS344292_08457 [Rhizopus microsporus]|nr:hypothetical protein RMCBS344292_08457 [Rhizopus microsporus]